MLRRSLIISILLFAVGCASHRPAPGAPPLEEIYYRRTGGLMGTDDRVTIRPDGTFKTSGRMMGSRTGRLSEAQVEELIRLFGNWSALKRDYPPPPRSAD